MFNPWFYLVLAVALVDWYCVWKDRYRVRYVTKPLTLIVLIGWFTVCGGWDGAAFIFGVGLVFSLAGDIFLLKGVLITPDLEKNKIHLAINFPFELIERLEHSRPVVK